MDGEVDGWANKWSGKWTDEWLDEAGKALIFTVLFDVFNSFSKGIVKQTESFDSIEANYQDMEKMVVLSNFVWL